MNKKYLIKDVVDTHEVIQLLEDKLYEYNSTRTGKEDGHLFSRIIRNEKKNIIAGIAGWTWAGICEITQLWVDESVRKHGYGEMLLKAAEEEAKSKGSNTILIRSYSFQAPQFYEKHGYHTEHVIKGFPEGHNYHLLIKRID